jgi:hypothetical protein
MTHDARGSVAGPGAAGATIRPPHPADIAKAAIPTRTVLRKVVGMAGFPPRGQLMNEKVERWQRQQREYRRGDEASNHRDRQRSLDFRAVHSQYHKREQAENRGGSGHELRRYMKSAFKPDTT